MKNRQIEKLRRDMKYEINRIEILSLKIDTAERKVKEISDKITQLMNGEKNADQSK